MRVKHRGNVRIAEDTDMKNLLFGPDADLAEQVLDGFTKQASGVFTVTANTSENLSLGDLTTVKGLFLRVSVDCTIKLNGSADAIQLRRGGALSSNTARLLIEAEVSAVEVTAPVASDVSGVWCVWGD